MTEPGSHPDDRAQPREEERLAEALAALYDRAVEVPREVDDAVRQEIRDAFDLRFRRAGSRRSNLSRLLVPAASAAALVVAAGVWHFLSRPRPDPGQASASATGSADPADFDRSGRLDILDAYGLALRLESGEPADPSLDLTGDGVVDDLDVRAMAMRAVALNGSAGGAG